MRQLAGALGSSGQTPSLARLRYSHAHYEKPPTFQLTATHYPARSYGTFPDVCGIHFIHSLHKSTPLGSARNTSAFQTPGRAISGQLYNVVHYCQQNHNILWSLAQRLLPVVVRGIASPVRPGCKAQSPDSPPHRLTFISPRCWHRAHAVGRHHANRPVPRQNRRCWETEHPYN